MYNHFNPNPCGKNVGDCTVRAIVKATGMDWGEIYLRLCIQGYLDDDMRGYSRGSSYARRHYVRGHYSRTDAAEHLRSQINDMMRETDDDRIKDALRRAMDMMED